MLQCNIKAFAGTTLPSVFLDLFDNGNLAVVSYALFYWMKWFKHSYSSPSVGDEVDRWCNVRNI